MKKNICLRLDEELINIMDEFRLLTEQIYQIEMNQTIAAETLIKTGVKNQIKLLKNMIDSPFGKEEFDNSIANDLNDLISRINDYTSKGKKGELNGHKK